jgi:hypothetical protein
MFVARQWFSSMSLLHVQLDSVTKDCKIAEARNKSKAVENFHTISYQDNCKGALTENQPTHQAITTAISFSWYSQQVHYIKFRGSNRQLGVLAFFSNQPVLKVLAASLQQSVPWFATRARRSWAR